MAGSAAPTAAITCEKLSCHAISWLQTKISAQIGWTKCTLPYSRKKTTGPSLSRGHCRMFVKASSIAHWRLWFTSGSLQEIPLLKFQVVCYVHEVTIGHHATDKLFFRSSHEVLENAMHLRILTRRYRLYKPKVWLSLQSCLQLRALNPLHSLMLFSFWHAQRESPFRDSRSCSDHFFQKSHRLAHPFFTVYLPKFLQIIQDRFSQSLENFQAYIRPVIMTDIQHTSPLQYLPQTALSSGSNNAQKCNGVRRKHTCHDIHEQTSALSHNVAVFAFVPDPLKLYVQKNNSGRSESEVGWITGDKA
jgi:hypothetical protein